MELFVAGIAVGVIAFIALIQVVQMVERYQYRQDELHEKAAAWDAHKERARRVL